MKVIYEKAFVRMLNNQSDYIAKDKIEASRKFKRKVIESIEKASQFPFMYRKSIVFEDIYIREIIVQGYRIVYKIDELNQTLIFFLLIGHDDVNNENWHLK